MEARRLFFLLSIFFSFNASISTGAKIGINYGQVGNNLPSPDKSIDLIEKLGAKMVKIYDANPKILKSLSKTNLQVSIMVPNQLVVNISSNENLACKWIEEKVLPYYPKTRIRFLLVANEYTSATSKESWPFLVPAVRNMMKALQVYRIKKVKVGTTLAMDVMASSFPPSNGSFRSDLLDPVIKPLLKLASKSKSFFFLDAYPYFPYAEDRGSSIRKDYAMFGTEEIVVKDPGSGLGYTNLLDAMLDSVYYAMERVGYSDVRICLAETGWPSAGGFGASLSNAAMYNRNLVKKLVGPKPGTPYRPGTVIPTFIFALFNENQKPGPDTERHWGLFAPDGSSLYSLDVTGKTTSYPPLPAVNVTFWCVVAPNTNQSAVEAAVDWACKQKFVNCGPIQKGKPCFGPGHGPDYAFSAYWAQYNTKGGSCFFNALAVETDKNPGSEACKIPSVTF